MEILVTREPEKCPVCLANAFIATPGQTEPLVEIVILLHFDGQWEEMKGTVVWIRPEAGDQPAGIGVQLTDTTGRYLQYLASLTES